MKQIDSNAALKTIPITFDKSHLIVIGERLYAQSLELIRELVSNAYDADATHVWIELDEHSLKVRDNGSGMDEAGLIQFFHIGSQEKRYNKISPVYKRPRIGEFGIGKFSVLSACHTFKVTTQQGSFAAEVVFDKTVWNAIEQWEVPLRIIEPNTYRGNGTTVLLERLSKPLSLPDIERFMRERVPLKVPNFTVYLNGKRIQSTVITGKRFPVSCRTSFGNITGEIVLANLPVKPEERGISCFVKDVFITRGSFGFEYGHTALSTKLIGEIHADFVPITSDRNRFMIDTPEYQALNRVMRGELLHVLKKLKEHIRLKDVQKADAVLKQALSHIRKALKKNPEFAQEVQAPVARKENDAPPELFEKEKEKLNEEEAALQTTGSGEQSEQDGNDGAAREENGDAAPPREHAGLSPTPAKKSRDSRKVRIRALDGREFMARKMHLGTFSIVCRVEELGETNLPSITEGGIVYINRSHPLYRRFEKNIEALTLYITELISQEIARGRAGDVAAAFTLQNQILSDAWG